MRAIRFDEFGDYSVLRVVEVPVPRPGPGELLVKVAVAPVNPIDSTIRSGRFPAAKPPPTIPGQEACGRVAAGSAPGLGAGDRVLVRGGYGSVRDGTWAEYVTATAAQALPASDGLSDEAVAASGSGYLTAVLALEKGGFTAGQTVVVLGAGGAVGNATCQLARARGAGLVIGTVGSTAKTEAARSSGLEAVIDLSTESLPDGVARLTEGRGADIVIDPVGGALTGQAVTALADDGVVVVLGYVAGPAAEINLPAMVRKRARIQAIALGRTDPEVVRSFYESLREDFTSGALQPLVGRVFPLEQAAEAQRYLDAERPFGKVLLRPGEST